MIFSALHEAAKRGELLLIDGGFCHFHVRKDGQITIGEIISTRKGAGGEMLLQLRQIARSKGCTSLFAKCPSDLPSNKWYKKRGFIREKTETLKTGGKVIHWRLPLV